MAEHEDLAILQTEQRKLKISGYEYLVALSKMTDAELKTCGHRNGQAQAVLDALKMNQKRIKSVVDAHIKKYPD